MWGYKCEVINVNSVLAVLCGIFSFNLLAFIYYHVAHGKRHTHGFLLSETDNPRRIALMEDVYNLPNEERGQPDHTQMDSSPPSQPQRTSLHGSSSYTSSHDGSLQAIWWSTFSYRARKSNCNQVLGLYSKSQPFFSLQFLASARREGVINWSDLILE